MSPTNDATGRGGGRHRHRPSRTARALRWGLAACVGGAVVWAGATFYGTYSRADGEPTNVIVATWMRENNMGVAVAQLENLYYRYIDTPEVGGTPTLSADLSREDSAGADDSDLVAATEPPPAQQEQTAQATIAEQASRSEPVLLGATTRAGTPAATSPRPERPHLTPPPPIVSPVSRPQPKEGEWQPVASRVDGIPAVYVTRVRADDVHTSYYASVMWIDTLLTKAMLVPGYEEPGGPDPYGGALPQDLWPDVLANVNGAFRLDDTLGGYYFRGKMVKPLVEGKASAVIYRDGTIAIGKWGRDLTMTKDVESVRQNLDLIVDKGTSQVADGADHVTWGATTDKESLAWRAALGQRDDGSLVYVGSPYLSADGLANVLVGAGVKRAMVLDMNEYWAAGFYFRHKKDGTPLCRYLDPSIAGPCDRFLHRYKRDSFQFLARSSNGT